MDSWKVEGLQYPLINNCKKSWVGGPGVAAKGSISKHFTSPFELTNLIVEVDIGLFDQWASGWEGGKNNNKFVIYINGENVY